MSTDHIAIKTKEKNDGNQEYKKPLFLEMKSKSIFYKDKYGSHFESKDSSWVASVNLKTINNKSGSTFNILTNQSNELSGCLKMGMMERKIANRKKGVCEFYDITQPYSSNWDKNYNSSFNEDKNIFKSYQGIFSQMYDAARKNGNISIPFRNENSINFINKKGNGHGNSKDKSFIDPKVIEKHENLIKNQNSLKKFVKKLELNFKSSIKPKQTIKKEEI